MEINGKQKLRELVQKVGITRLVILVLTGIFLLVLSLPEGKTSGTGESQKETGKEDIALLAMQQYAKKQEEKTAEILSRVEGIGDVKVMLTLSSSEEKITLQNSDMTEDTSEEADKAGGSRKQEKQESKQESVLVQKEGEESPYVVQVNSPSIEGVVVVAEGVDSSRMKTEIIEAIQALFPIEPHKIKVMKME